MLMDQLLITFVWNLWVITLGHNNLSFSSHYTNVHGLSSNFSSVETHLATSSPNLFLLSLSETQLSSASSPDPFQISHHNLCSHFCSKGGVCTYCTMNTPITRLLDLESPHLFSGYKYSSLQLLSFAFAIAPLMLPTFSPSSSILLPAMSLLTSHPHAEVLHIGDFSVYCTPH